MNRGSYLEIIRETMLSMQNDREQRTKKQIDDIVNGDETLLSIQDIIQRLSLTEDEWHRLDFPQPDFRIQGNPRWTRSTFRNWLIAQKNKETEKSVSLPR